MDFLLRPIDAWLGRYAVFVANLRPIYIFFLAVLTATSGATCIDNLQKPLFGYEDPDPVCSQIILLAAITYLIGLGAFYRWKRTLLPPPQNPPPPPTQVTPSPPQTQVTPPSPPQTPPPQPRYPNLRIFFGSTFPSTLLAFFTFVDDPLKGAQSIYTPILCISAYLHILLVMALFRLSRDRIGLSEGFLGAAFGLLYALTPSMILRFLLLLSTILLTGFRNLQFQFTNRRTRNLPRHNIQTTLNRAGNVNHPARSSV